MKKLNTFLGLLMVLCAICFIFCLNNRKAGNTPLSPHQPKVSVIIPIYNAEKYIQDCLNSVMNQTLRDIEIICIDDGSTDNSAQIIELQFEKDKRFKIVHQRNHGVSVARNCGIDLAKGKYIKFVDADDILDHKACECLYDMAETNNTDVLYHCFSCSDNSYTSHLDDCILNGPVLDIIAQSSVIGFYKRKFILDHNIYFNPRSFLGEDIIFNILCNSNANKIQCTARNFYTIRVGHTNHLTANVASIPYFYCLVSNIKYLHQQWCASGNFNNQNYKLYFFRELSNIINRHNNDILNEYISKSFSKDLLSDKVVEQLSTEEQEKINLIIQNY